MIYSQVPSRRVAYDFRIATVLWAITTPGYADDVAVEKSDFALFNPTPDAELRSFDTDRPLKANVAYTVDAGHFQYETDIAVFAYRDTEGAKTQSWTVLDPTLKLGVTNTIDAELQITPYESVVTDGAQRTTVSGHGDTFARLKINLIGDDHGAFAAALLPYVKLPTAPSGLGNRKVEGGMILPISFSAPDGFTVIVMPEGDYLKDAADKGYHGAFDFLINVSHPLTKRWTFYSEVFTAQPLQSRQKPSYTADEALTYALGPNLQLDFGGNFGLTSAAPRAQLFTGLSQRF